MNIITTGQDVKASLNLTPAEMRLIRAFRKITDGAQSFILNTSEGIAEDHEFQRREVKSVLRLVAGGAA